MAIVFCFEKCFSLIEVVWFWLAFFVYEFVVEVDILVSGVSLSQRVLVLPAKGDVVVMSICGHRFLLHHLILWLRFLHYLGLRLLPLSWLISIGSYSAGHIPGRLLGISSDLELNYVCWLVLLGVLLRLLRGPSLASAPLLHLVYDVSLFGLFSRLQLSLHLLFLLLG